MTQRIEAENLRGEYTINDELVRVVELNPAAAKSSNSDDVGLLHRRAQQVRLCLEASYGQKFTTGENPVMSDNDLRTLMDERGDQYERVVKPFRNARYILALSGVRSGNYGERLDTIQAFARIERYRPRRNPLMPYPNLTDLETLDGAVGRDALFGSHAAAVLYSGLGNSDNWERPVAAQVEAPNIGEIAFLESVGFEQVASYQQNDFPFEHIQMKARNRVVVQAALREQFDFLPFNGNGVDC